MPFVPAPVPTATTPDAVMAYQIQVRAEIVELNEAVRPHYQRNPRLTEGIVQARDRFTAEAEKYFLGYIVEGGWEVTWPSDAWRQTAQFQAKNEAWREIFARIGIRSAAPPPQKVPESTTVSEIKDLLVTAGVIGGIIWIFSQFK
jgi:hypothetical protein